MNTMKLLLWDLLIIQARFSPESGSDQYLEHVQTIDVSDQWVTHLTWLPWISTSENERELQSLGNRFRRHTAPSNRRRDSRSLHF